MTDLGTRLRDVVGDKTAKVLASALDLHTVSDLLRHYPRRYAERGELTDLADLRVGEVVTVLAEVEKAHSRRMQQRKGWIFEAVVGDRRRRLSLTWFNQPWRERELKPGTRALFAGKVGEFRGKRQLVNPDYQLLDADSEGGVEAAAEFAGALIPVYPAAEKLASWQIAKCVRIVLDTLAPVADPVPELLRDAENLLDLDVALRAIHRPESREELAAARHRLKWDEAFTLQVVLAQRRHAARQDPTPPRVRRPGGLVDTFEARLPFTLTDGQVEVAAVLDTDLGGTVPMHRLLQGEVGSGKTVLALRSMLTVVDSGGQAVLMAPTEVLAVQHLRSIRELLGPLGQAGELGAADVATQVVLLTGSATAAARRAALGAIADGTAGIVVGTHALLEPDVVFHDLGLVVVDEQHRFGVEQRDVLRGKGATPPHLLVMTATPIPRTVAMTVYGDLETSTLTELPRGRAPIASHVVPSTERPDFLDRTWQRIREEVAQGHQAFVVCPRIGSPADGAAGGSAGDDMDGLDEIADPDTETARRPPLAVLDVFPMLTEGPLAGLRVELLHGRLATDVKDSVMRRFAAGEIDVLVSTTVIEVGVDVANATVMVVLDADRFGVSQLHQLRGRVGRGSAAAVCLLVTEMPEESDARHRVAAVAATSDGFALARLDLEQRREGDVLGAAQAGRRRALRLLELLADEELILAARREAGALVEADPELAGHPALRAALAEMVDEERAEYLEKA